MEELTSLLPKLASVFVLAFLYFWASIPAGVALGIAPFLVALTAWASYTSGVSLMAMLGAPLRAHLLKRLGGQAAAKPDSAVRRVWERFGLIGLAMLAPVTIGALVGALVGLSLGTPPRKMIALMSLGAAVWSGLLTLAAVLGAAAVK